AGDDGGTHAVARFLHGRLGQADDVERGQAAAEMNFDFNQRCVDADARAAENTGESHVNLPWFALLWKGAPSGPKAGRKNLARGSALPHVFVYFFPLPLVFGLAVFSACGLTASSSSARRRLML